MALASGPDPLARARARVIVALDLSSPTRALALVKRLQGGAGFYKIGHPLFSARGPEIVRAVVARGERVFLDLKFHDIPHIVAEACAQAARLRVSLLTLHASGGPRMLEAAREALEKHSRVRRPRLLGVTLLTSLGPSDIQRVGFRGGVRDNVVRLARLAQRHGCDGVVAAPSDAAALRQACGENFLLVTPGIRPSGHPAERDDQARVATAAEAIRAGADYVVVGRPILRARSPRRALDALAESIARVLP